MIERTHRDAEGGFAITVPAGWEVERDGEGGVLLTAHDGQGLLHLMPFERDPSEDLDPAEELYAFLAEHEIELEEDEVEDIDLPETASLALCEYVADDEDESVYWMVGVATSPGRLVFASYSCTAGDEEQEVEVVKRILSSLSFGNDPPSTGS